MENFVFEDELEASKEILNKLLDPSITLSQSLKLYEEGLEHIKIAQRLI
ncbi:MAG: exodeoxyribonuclease VII small subunit, partial [Epsilonproteobacteria bacterium]|nr:exodeoxyribonuclease VII small subunit [Campylobacterota bacterium]